MLLRARRKVSQFRVEKLHVVQKSSSSFMPLSVGWSTTRRYLRGHLNSGEHAERATDVRFLRDLTLYFLMATHIRHSFLDSKIVQLELIPEGPRIERPAAFLARPLGYRQLDRSFPSATLQPGSSELRLTKWPLSPTTGTRALLKKMFK